MGNTISNSVRTFSQTARLMLRQPRFFLATVLVLALGIGMSTALFSVTYGVLLKPLPVQQQDRLVVVWKGDPKDVAHVGELSRPDGAEQYPQYSESGEFAVVTPLTDYVLGSNKPAIFLLWAIYEHQSSIRTRKAISPAPRYSRALRWSRAGRYDDAGPP